MFFESEDLTHYDYGDDCIEESDDDYSFTESFEAVLTEDQEQMLSEIKNMCLMNFIKVTEKESSKKLSLSEYENRKAQRSVLDNALRDAAILQGLTEDNIKKILKKKMTDEQIDDLPSLSVIDYLPLKAFHLHMPIYLPFLNIDLLSHVAACLMTEKDEKDTTSLCSWAMKHMRQFVFVQPMNVIHCFLEGSLIEYMQSSHSSCKRAWNNLNKTILLRKHQSEDFKKMTPLEQKQETNMLNHEMEELMYHQEVYFPTSLTVDTEELTYQTIMMYYDIEAMPDSYKKMMRKQSKLPSLESMFNEKEALLNILEVVKKYQDNTELLSLLPSQNKKILMGEIQAIAPLVLPDDTLDEMINKKVFSYFYLPDPLKYC